MNSIAIKGIICPILTPMYEDESINEQELRNQVNRLIDAGIHGLFAFGTNGESYALSTAEKERVLEIVVEETNHRVPVYAGSGCITTKETIALSKKAFEIGADALSIVTPFYAAASQEELYAHYMDVASAVDMPIVMYNIPPRTGNALAPATVRRLAQSAPNIVGVKDSSGNFDNMKQYIEQTATLDREFSVLSGNDSLILPALVFGGKGGIAGCANVFPRAMVKIYETWAAGDLEGAKRAQDDIRPFRNCFKYGTPNTIIKLATKELGYPVGNCRKPFCQLSEEGMEQMRVALQGCVSRGMC